MAPWSIMPTSNVGSGKFRVRWFYKKHAYETFQKCMDLITLLHLPHTLFSHLVLAHCICNSHGEPFNNPLQNMPKIAVAFNLSPPKPSDRTQERDRLLAKLETGMVQKIYFQFGSDLELLQSSLEWLASLPNHTTERRNTKSHFTTAIDSDDDPTTSTSTSPSLPQVDLELSPDPSLRQHWRIALHYNSVITKRVTDG